MILILKIKIFEIVLTLLTYNKVLIIIQSLIDFFYQKEFCYYFNIEEFKIFQHCLIIFNKIKVFLRNLEFFQVTIFSH